jgi:Phosphoenolpyruvate phosphomutase
MPDAADRIRRFGQLHESGCFVIPNPWDVGSARVLAGLGFPALASTSSTTSSIWPREASRRGVRWPPYSVQYPEATVSLLGWRVHWMVAFFVLSIVFAFALRGRFGVVL